MQQSYYRPVPTPSQGPSEPQSQLQTHTLDTVPAWVDERQDANHGLSADTSPDLPLTTIRRPPSIPPYLQPPYGFYRAYSPYFNTSIPAARGYLPQRLQQESRPVSRGPRAVPLRISRYAANLSSSGPRPVPTLSLPLERPYSVPTYPNQHTNGGNDDGITPPLRPATSSEVDDIDKLVPPRPLVFPQRRAAQEGRNAPHALRKGSVEDAKPAQKTPSTRAVAKRGSKKPAPASVSCGMETVPSKPSTTSAVSPDKLAEPQKRPIGSTEPESNPVKKSKINVIGGQFESITPPGRSVDSLEKVSSTADPLTQEALSTTQGRRQAGRGDDDTTVTGSDVEEETTTTMLADVQSA
ncbi:hypothetical protein GGS23DRAFT_576568 [Durotheca rogersii]|uniref:uncharacterized protein n=1 Tax=Durotheca rogersii TaxID=419775 RepID=UPI002220F589|nr:uncharacterized protein GGS23DRAFT_576568 [Durotheca rogersii]KAI5861381.1 hypothetical protein GGS23DRAFT_576568 [Durotheca rogersii]